MRGFAVMVRDQDLYATACLWQSMIVIEHRLCAGHFDDLEVARRFLPGRLIFESPETTQQRRGGFDHVPRNGSCMITERLDDFSATETLERITNLVGRVGTAAMNQPIVVHEHGSGRGGEQVL